jgi:dienelactone hydrolase
MVMGPFALDPGPWPVFQERGEVIMTSDIPVDVDIYYPGYDRWLDKYYRDQEGPFEVIVFSPGYGTPAPAYEDYLAYWASWGFVVAGVSWEYEGDRADDVAYLDHGKVLDLLDQMASEGNWRDPFYGVPDTNLVGAVGHSRGGRAAFMATSQEDRIICASAWMPTLNDSLAVSERASLQLFGGEVDDIAPPEEWQVPLYISIDDGDIVYIEVFGGGHGTDRDLHPVMALDLFRFHIKGDGSVESGLQGDELKGRAEAGEFRLRMRMGGEEYDSHPELSEEPNTPAGDDTSGSGGVVLLLVVAMGGGLLIFGLHNERYKRVFRPGPRKRDR